MNFVTQQMKPAVHQLVNKVERCILTHFLAQFITFDFLGRFMFWKAFALLQQLFSLSPKVEQPGQNETNNIWNCF